VNPVRGLTVAGAGVIAGGALVAVGTKLVWATATPHSAPVAVPGFPNVVLAGGRLTLDASAVQAGYLFGLGLLLALVPLGWLVTGPKGRALLALIAVGISAGVLWGVYRTRHELVARAEHVAVPELRTASFRVASGPGIAVTGGGAALAAISALGGAAAGKRAPRLGLPEGPDRNGRS
jgi:hypothetical protein